MGSCFWHLHCLHPHCTAFPFVCLCLGNGWLKKKWNTLTSSDNATAASLNWDTCYLGVEEAVECIIIKTCILTTISVLTAKLVTGKYISCSNVFWNFSIQCFVIMMVISYTMICVICADNSCKVEMICFCLFFQPNQYKALSSKDFHVIEVFWQATHVLESVLFVGFAARSLGNIL